MYQQFLITSLSLMEAQFLEVMSLDVRSGDSSGPVSLANTLAICKDNVAVAAVLRGNEFVPISTWFQPARG